MSFTIRKAEVQDAAAVAHVQIESWRTTYAGIVSEEYLASMDKEKRTERWQEQFGRDGVWIFVAEDESGVFGFISGGKIREELEGYEAELYTIYLLQERQGQGAGRRLCSALVSGMSAAGFKSMIVWVLEQNPSVSFYTHLGAIRVAEQLVGIGGVDLPELAFGWPSLAHLISSGGLQQR